jgi:hypothetical protein
MTNQLEDLFALINVGMSFQDRLLVEHFSKDTSDTPHVDSRCIPFEGEQQLWRTIPSRHHETCILSYSLAVSLARHRWCAIVMSSQTKIGDLQNSRIGNEDIGGFHVAM